LFELIFLFYLISIQYELIEHLLKNGARSNEKDADRRSCVHLACKLGDHALVCLLLKYNVSKEDADKDGYTPIMISSLHGHLNVVRTLIEHKCDLNKRDEEGRTALTLACQYGHYEIVEELLKNGADLNVSSRNPIKIALQGGFSDIVKLLQVYATLSYASILDSRMRQDCPAQSPQPPIRINSYMNNSKSFDSFRAKSARYAMDKSNTQYSFHGNSITPVEGVNNKLKGSLSFRLNASQQYHQPTNGLVSSPMAAYARTFEMINEESKVHQSQFLFGNRSTLIELSESGDRLDNKNEEVNSSFKTALNESLNVSKKPISSRFKQVKDKLMRRSTVIALNQPASFIENKKQKSPSYYIKSPTKIANDSVSSFRVVVSPSSSYKVNNDDRVTASPVSMLNNSTRLAPMSNSCMYFDRASLNVGYGETPKDLTLQSDQHQHYLYNQQLSDTIFNKSANSLAFPASTTSNVKANSKNSLLNSSFVQMLRKRFKFLGNNSAKSPISTGHKYSNCNINAPTADNDCLQYSCLNENELNRMHRSKTDTIASSTNTNETAILSDTYRNRQIDLESESSDDVAHIFNRNSLNDFLNPRRSFKRETNSIIISAANNSNQKEKTFGEMIVGHSYASSSKYHSINCDELVTGNYSKLAYLDKNFNLARSQMIQQESQNEKKNSTNVQDNLTNDQRHIKRPSYLDLNIFKKETSI
jgi:hypothetical protein